MMEDSRGDSGRFVENKDTYRDQNRDSLHEGVNSRQREAPSNEDTPREPEAEKAGLENSQERLVNKDSSKASEAKNDEAENADEAQGLEDLEQSKGENTEAGAKRIFTAGDASAGAISTLKASLAATSKKNSKVGDAQQAATGDLAAKKAVKPKLDPTSGAPNSKVEGNSGESKEAGNARVVPLHGRPGRADASTLKQVAEKALDAANSTQTKEAAATSSKAQSNSVAAVSEKLEALAKLTSRRVKNGSEESAKAQALEGGKVKGKKINVVDKEQLAKQANSSGPANAKQSSMQLNEAFEGTEFSEALPKALERPVVQTKNAADGLPLEGKRKKAAASASKVSGEEVGSLLKSANNANRRIDPIQDRTFSPMSEMGSRTFEVQVTKDVQSSRPADAVRAVQQAFNQIGEAQPSKMRFSLNMSNGERIDIQVVQRDGGLQVRMAAQSPELREALTRSWDTLTQSAQNKGIRLVPPVIDALPQAQNTQFDRGNTQQQSQTPSDRQAGNQDPRGGRQESQSDARDRESFREAFRENLREHAQRQQPSFAEAGAKNPISR